MKTMQCKGFRISERKDGTYSITLKDWNRTYRTVCANFNDAGAWVWEMADNNDHARAVNHRMCEVFGKQFFDY